VKQAGGWLLCLLRSENACKKTKLMVRREDAGRAGCLLGTVVVKKNQGKNKEGGFLFEM
jgi:hypothetical protein